MYNIHSLELTNDDWIIELRDVDADPEHGTLTGDSDNVVNVYCYDQHRDLTFEERREWLADGGNKWLVSDLLAKRAEPFFNDDDIVHRGTPMTEFEWTQYDPYHGEADNV